MGVIETHPLPPFVPGGARVLMLGSFPPPRSRWTMEFYYPNWQNDMWRIIGLVFFHDAQHFLDAARKTFREAQIRAFLQEKGIAISDMAYRAERLAGNAADKSLHIVETLDLAALLSSLPHCRTLLATGELASVTLHSLLPPGTAKARIDAPVEAVFAGRILAIHRLPSSSRAYPLPLAQKAQYYARFFSRQGMTQA